MSEDAPYSGVVKKAREYYNSTDADRFYFTVWGGEDLHLGLYETPDESIFDASRRTVATMAGKIELNENTRVLDIGAGYGGSARYLAKTHKCPVVAFNLSEVENERDRAMNKEQGLDDLVSVVDGDFENLPFDDNSFEVVWSQDAMLHSGDRYKIFQEVDRVLKPGGVFIFTDPMQRPDADPKELQPVYERIHLDNLGSVKAYDDYAKKLGWEKVEFDDYSHQLPRHYQRVHDILDERYDELKDIISTEYMDRMKTGLQHWVNAGNSGNLHWGILVYKKPA